MVKAAAGKVINVSQTVPAALLGMRFAGVRAAQTPLMYAIRSQMPARRQRARLEPKLA
jgi:hypothetical protein